MKSSFSAYPFGSPMPNRSFSASSYKYGFNGKEKDDEVKGGGNSVDFGARNYDSRLGRWLSVDSDNERTPDVSPYSYTKCNPIFFTDFKGRRIKPTNKTADLALRNYISSFDIVNKDGTTKMTATDLFQLSKSDNATYNSDAKLTVSQFKAAAKKAGLDPARVDEAASVYKSLKVAAVYEIKVIPDVSTEKATYTQATNNTELTALDNQFGSIDLDKIKKNDVSGLSTDKAAFLGGDGSEDSSSEYAPEGIFMLKNESLNENTATVKGIVKSIADNTTDAVIDGQVGDEKFKEKND